MPTLRRPTAVFDIDSVLHATLAVMKERSGEFVSQKKSQETGAMPTSKFVLQKLRSDPASDRFNLPEFDEEVRLIKSHFIADPNIAHDEFITKVKEILATGVVTERMIGFVVALPHLYHQKVNRASALTKIADKYSQSSYIGEIGTREEFFVKLVATHQFEKEGQNLTLYKVADQLGNFGFFFAKTGTLNDEEGKPIVDLYDCFLMKATPKKHEIGKTGVRETQFSRVRIIENVGKGSNE